MTRSFTTAAILVGLFLTGGCGKTSTGDDDDKKGDGGVKVDQSTPQKTVESFKAAAAAKDWKGMFACLTEDSKKTLTTGAMLTAGFSTIGSEDRKKSLEALTKKHGLDAKAKPKPGEDPLKDVKDMASLFGDLMTWSEENMPKPKDNEDRGTMLQQLAEVELENYKIEGDKATADVMKDGKKKGQPADFRKIDGKWYIDFAASRKRKRNRGPKFPRSQ